MATYTVLFTPSRRLLVDLIDCVAVVVVCFILILTLWGSVPNDIVLLSLAAVFFCYFVLLKASKIGTLGYRVGRVKIVGPDGRRPGLVPLTLRLMFMTLGPLNYVIDVVWLSSDSHRQALRDKFAQTWVVNRKAEVIGTGPLLCRYYEICGYNFLFREIEEETKPTATR